jgi:hypothetical protein
MVGLCEHGPGEKLGEAIPSPEKPRLHSRLLFQIPMARRNHKGGVMGILGKIFGDKPDYPSLDSSDPAAKQLESLRPPLEKLADEISDPLEVVPAEETAYIFVGKPPKKFGIAWVEDGDKIVNFKSLVEEKGLSPISLQRLSDELKKAYIAHEEEPRYLTRIRDREVVVIPSTSLLNNLKSVVEQTVG